MIPNTFRGISITTHQLPKTSTEGENRLQNATFALKGPLNSYFCLGRVSRTLFTASSIIGLAAYNSELNPLTPSNYRKNGSQEGRRGKEMSEGPWIHYKHILFL